MTLPAVVCQCLKLMPMLGDVHPVMDPVATQTYSQAERDAHQDSEDHADGPHDEELLVDSEGCLVLDWQSGRELSSSEVEFLKVEEARSPKVWWFNRH